VQERFHSIHRAHVPYRHDIREYARTHGRLSLPEQTALQNQRIALQRDIFRWSTAQSQYMPHIQYARYVNNFDFKVIYGQPPLGEVDYASTAHPSTYTEPTLLHQVLPASHDKDSPSGMSCPCSRCEVCVDYP
jgi:hypothetical protein